MSIDTEEAGDDGALIFLGSGGGGGGSTAKCDGEGGGGMLEGRGIPCCDQQPAL
jgi:hypothetical protein